MALRIAARALRGNVSRTSFAVVGHRLAKTDVIAFRRESLDRFRGTNFRVANGQPIGQRLRAVVKCIGDRRVRRQRAAGHSVRNGNDGMPGQGTGDLEQRQQSQNLPALRGGDKVVGTMPINALDRPHPTQLVKGRAVGGLGDVLIPRKSELGRELLNLYLGVGLRCDGFLCRQLKDIRLDIHSNRFLHSIEINEQRLRCWRHELAIPVSRVTPGTTPKPH